MMKHFFITDAAGVILETGFAQDEALALLTLPAGQTLRFSETQVDPNGFYWANDALQPLPDRPNLFVEFDVGLGSWVDPASALADAKLAAVSEINRQAGLVRQQFVTESPALQMIYLRKETEARDYLDLAAAPADLTDFPMMAAEVGITAATATDLATLWRDQADFWVGKAAQIEGIRAAAFAQVEAATTTTAIDALIETATTDLWTVASS
ncbi:MAG: hypothetical protein AAF727_15365 [Pseudomonadota bacterium]